MTPQDVKEAVDKFMIHYGHYPTKVAVNPMDWQKLWVSLSPPSRNDVYVNNYRVFLDGYITAGVIALSDSSLTLYIMVDPFPAPVGLGSVVNAPLPPATLPNTAQPITKGNGTYTAPSGPINFITPLVDLMGDLVKKNFTPKCECGATKVGSANHSSWCPA